MFKTITKCAAAAAVGATMLLAQPALSQDNTRNFEQGSVWTVNYVTTKPGQFNAYLNDLENVWRTFLEAQMEEGDVLSYKILNVVSPRGGESNLILLVELRDMAVFDRGPEYFEELTEEIMGSQENMLEANIDRGALRTLDGSVLTRELTFMEDE